ncbi:MAG TPA: hypothetical protein VL179_08120 [Mycobacterium sp.]|nr:hypothetical protein [Mycobacterium sp.]
MASPCHDIDVGKRHAPPKEAVTKLLAFGADKGIGGAMTIESAGHN